MNRITRNDDFAVTFRFSPNKMEGGCPAWWLGQVELRIGRVCDASGVDEDGYLCIEFWFDSVAEIETATAEIAKLV